MSNFELQVLERLKALKFYDPNDRTTVAELDPVRHKSTIEMVKRLINNYEDKIRGFEIEFNSTYTRMRKIPY